MRRWGEDTVQPKMVLPLIVLMECAQEMDWRIAPTGQPQCAGFGKLPPSINVSLFVIK